MPQDQMKTKISRFQARHRVYSKVPNEMVDEPLSSSPLESRFRNLILTGGGQLLWETLGDTGEFSWSETLRVEAPTVGKSITIAASSVASLEKGYGIVLLIPYLDTDEVDPVGTWDYVSGDAVGTLDRLHDNSVPKEREDVFIIGFHGQDGNLYLRNGQVLENGVPTILGGNVSVGRSIITADGNASGGVWADIGFLYLPDRCRLHVTVNGVEQIPYSATFPTPDGYEADWADAQYKEVEGTRTGHSAIAFSGIEWATSHTPVLGENVIITILPPSLSSGGGSVEPGLDGAYNDRSYINLHFDGIPDSQEPVVLKEVMEADAYTGTPRQLAAGYKVIALGVKRSVYHPEAAYQGHFAGGLLSSGDQFGPGFWFYNPQDWTTIEDELAGTTAEGSEGLGLFYDGIGISAADSPRATIARTFIPWSKMAGITVGNLPAVRESVAAQPSMDGSAGLFGQVAQNIHGELATGWGIDFIRWHCLDITLDGEFPAGHDIVTVGPYTLDPALFDSGIKFLGGTASVEKYIDAGETDYIFTHSNPTLSVVGENPDEFKAWLAYRTADDEYDLYITYGLNLDGGVARLVLFFSAEYSESEDVL